MPEDMDDIDELHSETFIALKKLNKTYQNFAGRYEAENKLFSKKLQNGLSDLNNLVYLFSSRSYAGSLDYLVDTLISKKLEHFDDMMHPCSKGNHYELVFDKLFREDSKKVSESIKTFENVIPRIERYLQKEALRDEEIESLENVVDMIGKYSASYTDRMALFFKDYIDKKNFMLAITDRDSRDLTEEIRELQMKIFITLQRPSIPNNFYDKSELLSTAASIKSEWLKIVGLYDNQGRNQIKLLPASCMMPDNRKLLK